MDKLTAAAATLFGIGLLILIHEWGHFWTARRMKLTVQEFSVGFGPALLRWRGRSGILYALRSLFLGGYVRVKEIEEDLMVIPESSYARPSREILRRGAVVLGGPMMNIFAAVLIFFIYSLWFAGLRVSPVIASVSQGSPAEKAGLGPGDEIVAIAYLERTELATIQRYISNHPGRPVRLKIRRDTSYLTLTIVPNRKVQYVPVRRHRTDAAGLARLREILFGRLERQEFGLIGVTFQLEPVPGQLFTERLKVAVLLTVESIWIAWQAVVAPFREPLLFADVAGPIRMTYEFVSYRWLGIMDHLRALGIISFALALINLFPIPVLDGGRILFLLMELIGRRRIYTLELRATYVGYVLLIMLMAFIALKDLHYVLFLRGR